MFLEANLASGARRWAATFYPKVDGAVVSLLSEAGLELAVVWTVPVCLSYEE